MTLYMRKTGRHAESEQYNKELKKREKTTNKDPVIIITQSDIYMILRALNDPK